VIDVTATTFNAINSGSGSRLDFTTEGAFSQPTMDERDLWSPGQERIVFVTLLICPYDSSFILPDVYVTPLTCTPEAQTVPELNGAQGVFVRLLERRQVSRSPSRGSRFSKQFL